MPDDRVCIICAMHESLHRELQDDKAWTQLPPIRALKGDRPWVMVRCWDDLTFELHDHIAAQDHDISQLRQALQDSARLIDMANYKARGGFVIGGDIKP